MTPRGLLNFVFLIPHRRAKHKGPRTACHFFLCRAKGHLHGRISVRTGLCRGIAPTAALCKCLPSRRGLSRAVPWRRADAIAQGFRPRCTNNIWFVSRHSPHTLPHGPPSPHLYTTWLVSRHPSENLQAPARMARPVGPCHAGGQMRLHSDHTVWNAPASTARPIGPRRAGGLAAARQQAGCSCRNLLT